MLKNSPRFTKNTSSWVNNLRILRFKNTKNSEYCFNMELNIERNFRICISVPFINPFLG